MTTKKPRPTRVTILEINGQQFRLKGWQQGKKLNLSLKKIMARHLKPRGVWPQGRASFDASWGINVDGQGTPFSGEIYFPKSSNGWHCSGRAIITSEVNPRFSV